jgi:transcriptional regulator with XRE-family HTH domain
MPSANPTVTTDADFVSPAARKLAAADAAPTILARTRLLASQPIEKVAKRCGITSTRLDLIERGIITATVPEQLAIRKAVCSSSEVLFEKQDSETRARENARF